MWSIFPKNLLANIFLKAINSKSCSHVFVPDKVLELENERQRLNYNENLNCRPFGKNFIFMPFGKLPFLYSFSFRVDETTKLTSLQFVVPLI